MATIKEIDNMTTCCREGRKTHMLLAGIQNDAAILENNSTKCLIKLSMHLPRDPAISLLVFTHENVCPHKDVYVTIHTAASLTITKNWE